MAIIAPTHAAFAQIGDGAIVVDKGDGFRPVFWPQAGEFAGTTNFITLEEFESLAETRIDDEPVTAVALFTDGLERLVLDFRTRTAHDQLFQQLVARLNFTDDKTLELQLSAWLDSPSVNDRTDDDKTMLLATRLQSTRTTNSVEAKTDTGEFSQENTPSSTPIGDSATASTEN
jgi:hypothetical protein